MTFGSMLLLAAVIPGSGPSADGPLIGRWRLAQQHYESGAHNFAAADKPVCLEFSRIESGVGAVLWTGDDRGAALPWPAFVTDHGATPVAVLEQSLDAEAGTVHVRYRVPAAEGDETVLEIEERYAVSKTDEGAGSAGARAGGAVRSGDSMLGSMTVRLFRGEEDLGSFVLSRRFERER